MAYKYSEDLQEMSDFLQAGIDRMAAITEPELTSVKHRLAASFKRDQLFIHSLLGGARPSDENIKLPTLTHIFGEPIKFERKAIAGETTPTDMERKKFVDEVNDWYDNFPELEDEKIFNKATLPGGETIIRAVAKKSGFEGFEDDEINIEFIVQVKQAISDKSEQIAVLKEAVIKTGNNKRNDRK